MNQIVFMNNYFGSLIFLSWLVLAGCDTDKEKQSERKSPNFIVIFTDDQGYGDLGCFEANHVRTPNIDQLAREGVKLTSFYVAAPLCTPSRAALLTGCYPKRVSMASGPDFPVLLAGDSKGLHPDEITIAEILKKEGYATGIFGKWHLGDQPKFLPTRQGFDEFFGLPYSHDIHPSHPLQDHFNFPPLPLLENETVIEMEPNADYFTKRITEKAIRFIESHHQEPFFLYIPHPIPHHPIHVSPEFMESVSDSVKTLLAREKENDTLDYTLRCNLYPQAIREIDWSVGQIVEALRKHKLDSNTLVIFTSDNGPDGGWDCMAGSTGPLRGRKGSTFEGGVRVPAIAWWPGQIPEGIERDELLTTMDLLPTFANLSGTQVPQDRVIDGKNIWPVLSGQPGAKSPHERVYYHQANELKAVRSGPWKYHHTFPRGAKNVDSRTVVQALYNLKKDIGETTDVSAQYPEIVEQLQQYFREFENELGKGDSLSNQCRPAGWVEDPKPLSKNTDDANGK